MKTRIYERPEKTSENREKERSYYIPYDSVDKALAGKRGESAFYRLLNGKWDFHYYERDIDVPDLRGGFSHLIAALAAKGPSDVRGISLIDRGYADFRGKLTALGAQID